LLSNEWIVNDTYPDRERKRTLFIYHVATGRIVVLGRFHNPPEYDGEWRVDLHPRFSPDGRLIVFDSPHTGEGRQMHTIDVSDIVG
jgi:Tol biopolymer transport system component